MIILYCSLYCSLCSYTGVHCVDFNQNDPQGHELKTFDHCVGVEYIIENVNPIDGIPYFQINENTGSLSLKVPGLDVPVGGYTIVVVCNSINTPSMNFVVNKINQNEYSPTFTHNTSLSIKIGESKKGSVLLTLNATDDDLGNYGVVTYSLSGHQANLLFSLDSGTGELKLTHTMFLFSVYNLTITAENPDKDIDSLVPQSAVTLVTADVNFSPSFVFEGINEFYSESVDENQPPPLDILTASCVDTETQADELEYSLAGDSAELFSISNEGMLEANQILDYETEIFYEFSVICSDGTEMTETTIQIGILPVNEFTPTINVDAGPFTFYYESMMTAGTVLASNHDENALVYIAGNDEDDGVDGVITYSFVGFHEDFKDSVSINSTNGDLVITNDFDTDKYIGQPPSPGFVIKVCDPDLKCAESVTFSYILIPEADELPIFDENSYNISVEEEIQANSVLEVTCSDEDDILGAIVSVEFSNATSDIESYIFLSNENNQVVGKEITRQIILKQSDYESNTSYTFDLVCTDEVDEVAYTTIVINIEPTNDLAPVFTKQSYFFNVSRTAPSDESYVVGTVLAIDKDIDVGGNVQYSLNSSEYNIYFSLNNDGGIILEKSLADFFGDIITFVVEAFDDDHTNNDFADIIIEIETGNYESPVFTGGTQIIEISELELIGSSVLSIYCNDTEKGDNGLVSYEIYAGNAGNAFRIDNKTGEIFVNNLLILPQGEDKVTYILTLKCSDNGIPSLSDYGTAVVRVFKADVLHPDIKNETIVLFIDEGVALNHLVTTITAIDLDTDKLRYYFLEESESVPEAFIIAPTNGEVTVNSAIDRETITEYSMIVIAEEVQEDNFLGAVKNDSAELFIYVRDTNDNSPDCGLLSDTVEVPGTLKLDRTIYQLNCKDDDVGNNGNIAYTLEDNFGIIDIEANGRIYLQNPLNNSNLSTFYLKINVSDQGKENNEIQLTILVIFSSSNDHIPVFTNLNTSISVEENSDLFNPIFTVMAEDRDKGLHGVVRFKLQDESLLPFVLIPNTGQLYITEALDFHVQSSYVLDISASDTEYTVYSTLTVNVLDINEYMPECSSTLFTKSITETSNPSDVEPIALGCTDMDKGANGDLVYEILTDNDNDAFTITSGAVKLVKMLDYETKEEYDLKVRVSDSGNPSFSTNVTVRIQVLALNEFSPVLTIDIFSETITEGTAIGYTVFTVQASDDDAGIHGKLKYTLEPTQTDFGIKDNGDLIVTGELDREVIENYMFEVIVRDSGTSPKTSTATISIMILDKDDNSPFFTEDLYTSTVDPEDAVLNGEVVAVECTDLDDGDQATVTYSIISSDDSQYFDISDDGKITISQNLPISSIYSFGVMCSGVLNLNFTDTAQVSITIVVESNITFSEAVYNVNLPENTATGTFISINATSKNNNDIQYTLIDGPTIFQISQGSGDLMLVGILDYETTQSYVLVVEATDKGSPPNTATVAVNLVVQNVNDESPSFVTIAMTLLITEEEADYPLLGSYKCTDGDLDSFGKITYTLSGYDDGYFLLDETSGDLILASALDYETVQSLTLQITCKDGGNLSDILSVPVTIEAANEFPPEFSTENIITISVDESIPIPSILTIGNELAAVDEDLPPHDSVYYSIISGNDDKTFYISSNEGSLTLIKKLDYETSPFYKIKVLVDDSGGQGNPGYPVLNSTIDVEIIISDVNDNSPMLNKNVYAGSLTESSQIDDHVEMVTLICTDADSGEYGMTTVTIVEGNDEGIFEIDNSNGKVVLKKEVDFESNTFYTLTVRCSDMGSPPRYDDASLTINIEDHSEYGPLFEEEIYEFSINETVILGSVVGEVTAVDADAGTGGDIVYTADTNGPFAIDSDSGVITVSLPLDYETPPVSFVFNVTAEDTEGEKDITIVTISIVNVDDNLPSFSAASYFGTINENSSPGQTVNFDIPISCSDADDEADNIPTTFTLVSDDSVPFSIDSESGEITSNDLLDFEIKDRYGVVINCFDSGLSNISVNVTIDIESYNEFYPFFIDTPYMTTIPENIGASTAIFTVEASDKDKEDNAITYSIFSGDEKGSFNIDSISGIIRTTSVSIDYEETQEYILTVAATNVPRDDSVSPTLISYIDLNITVTDINDNDPVLTATEYVATIENKPLGYIVTTVNCDDPDSGMFGEVEISLAGANADNFNLLPNGSIATVKVITKDLIFQVNCSDMGVPPRYSIIDIKIVKNNSNNAFPEFQNSSVSFTIFENHTVGEDIGCVMATDADGPNQPSGILTYSIELTMGEDHFIVNEDTGCIFVSLSLDYDEVNSYSYDITASDQGEPQYTNTIKMIITVENVEFDPPQFSQSIFAIVIAENIPSGALVTKSLICTDRDDGDIITYSISGGNENSNFEVNSTTGEVVLGKGLDYEVAMSHVITLRCNDPVDLFDEAIISVTVTAINEHTPILVTKLVYANEESPAGTEITIIEYVDKDAGIDGEVTFKLIEGDIELFSIIDDVLYFNKSLDRETEETLYPLLIQVADKGKSPRSSSNFINVSLSDINDNAPLPSKPIYTTIQVDATEDAGFLVETVSCSDADLDMNAEIMYSIAANSLLGIDSDTGVVTVIGDLRERETHTIAFTITCSDKGDPTLSSSFPIQVPIFDPNDNTPVFLKPSYSVTVPENYTLSVTFINVTASDDDYGLNGKIGYSLSDDYENLFYINSESGEISLLTELDFESDESYILEVLAVDGAADSPDRKTGTATVTVNVTGINEFSPECKKPIYTAILSEEDIGPILQLNCDDSDNGIDGEIDYAISQSQYSNLFTIDSTGWITVPASISPNASIEVYEIFVTVFDKGAPTKEHQVEVNFIYSFENKNTPVFNSNSYSTSSLESATVGTVILTVLATDDDPGLQGDVEYSVADTNYFRVNPQTGEIYISEELDYEQEKVVSFIVIASDLDPKEPLSSNVTVTINILDVNDNSPVCDLSFYSTEIGSSLVINETAFTVADSCEDIDGPQNSVLTYSLTPNSTFAVKENTGVIFVNGPLVAGSSNALTITVTDNGDSSLSTEITVSIVVRFDNVEPPQFSETEYSFDVSEDADLLLVIGQVTASDSDSQANDLQYTLTSIGYEDLFYVDPQSGDIILTSYLDYEYMKQYQITIKVQDSGSHDAKNVLSDMVNVTITVENVNDNTPVLNNNGLYGTTVNKTTAIDETVITITCTDDDLPPYANPSIPTNGFTSDIPFKLVESGDEWEVRVSSDLTVITGSMSYDVNFTCRDEGGEEVIGQVFLSVPDVDAPVFNQSFYEWNLKEDAESGETFSLILATSQDQSDVTYEIIDGNSENLFYIHPNTGVISLTGSLDFEKQSSYGLIVQATDEMQRSSTVLLRVFIIDVDDNIPLVPPSASLTIEHNKSPGFPVGTVECVDDDNTDGNFSFNLVEPSDTFVINNDGIISLDSILDTTPVYVLPVTCFDNSDPTAVSTGIVTIEVIFLNLYNPEFELSPYEMSINENAQVNSLVIKVTATDDDIGDQGVISYSISSVNDDKFYIDAETGSISVLTSLDRETQDTYALTVEAIDGGIVNTTSRKTGTATVNVYIQDVNDNTPVFLDQTYFTTILVNHTVLSDVIQVQCQDSDINVNGQFDYTIQPSHDSFIIDADGTITLAQTQTEETVYNFYTYCTDKGDPVLSSSALVTVVVDEVMFGDPIFANSSYSIFVPEDQELLVSFLILNATVDKEGIEIVYSIVSGNTEDTFTINSKTGELSLIDNLDYNTLSIYTLTVKATTLSFIERSSQVLVSISVTDVNDNDPIFVPLPFYTGQVDENDNIQTPVVQVNCTDEDTSNVLTYSISGENPENGDEYFDITDGGLIIVKQTVDYETAMVYTLNIRCSDGENDEDATVRIDVNPINEFQPVFLENVYKFDVDENAGIGKTIGYVNATDDDEGIHGVITFLVDDPGNLLPIFIDPTSGEILLSGLLDYEDINFYNISVIAKDSGGSESYVPIELTVNNLNDEPPVLTPAVTTYDGRIPTDTPSGFFIEFFTCTDEDGGSTAIAITSGNDKGYFKLNSFNHLLWNGTSDDFESDIVVTIMLKCTDEANDEDTASIAIVVGKPGVEPPTFTKKLFTDSIEENATTDTPVLSVMASPSLSNHTIEYSLFNFDFGLPFVIDSDSGLITVNDSLDFENFNFYSFPVQAKDIEDGSIALASIEITVLDINDNHPMVLPSTLTIFVKEDVTTDIAFAKFTCSDIDDKENGQTMFSIDDNDLLFRISASTGSVYLNKSLDYEETKQHNVTVLCVDGGSPQLTGSATLIVKVSGINEHHPQFDKDQYYFDILENSTLGSFVGSVSATDDDDGINGQFYYEVSGGTGSDYFRVDGADILVKNSPNASVSNFLTLLVDAIDNGPVSPLISTVLVNLDIIDVNDRPLFDQISYSALISTDVALLGDSLGTVACYDYDLGLNAELALSILQDQLSTNVSLMGNLVANGSVSAELVLNTVIAAGSYEVIIECTDSGSPSLSNTASFGITVIGVNTAPVFNESVYGISVHEDFETDTSILTVFATDKEDTSINETGVTYALLGGIGLGIFQINEQTGDLSIIQNLDYETTSTFPLTVGAIDKDDVNPKTGSATIVIIVNNINDNNPSISPPTFSATLDEGTYIAHEFHQFSCKDSDGGTTSFSVMSDPLAPFEISVEGLVTFSGTADYEMSKQYTVTVKCTDTPITPFDGSKESTATLAVSIQPVNFFPPTVTYESVYNISEGSEVGSVLLQLEATDPDNRGEIDFSTNSHTDVFTMNSKTGELSLTSALDRETKDFYSLTISISDGDDENGVTPMTTTVDIIISITDINDNSPTCTSTLETIEIVAGTYNQSHSLYNASCDDSDIDNNGVLIYTIKVKDNSPTEGTFKLNSETGKLTFNGTITKLSTASVITILVTDSGEDLLSTPAEIQLILTVVTGDDLRFEPDEFYVTISEATLPLTSFFNGSTFKNALKNADSNPTFSFSMDETIFLIDQTTGNVLLLSSGLLDYDEGLQMYSLGIQAAVGEDTAIAILKITITDFNDNPPEFSTNVYNGSVIENLDEAEFDSNVIVTLFATDIDSGENANITYFISTGGDSFEVDQYTGEIRPKKSFDREAISLYSVIVVAKDEGTPSLSSSASVSIEIIDENDNPPSFAIQQYIITLADNSKPGTVLETIVADDPDISGNLKYALKDADAELLTFIDIEPEDGKLRQTIEIPFNHKPIYSFKVTANDIIHTDETNIVLQIASVSSLELFWKENTENQTENIFTFLTSTSNYNVSSVAEYNITEGDLFDHFDITGDGILTHTVLLDRENISSYQIKVLVSDSKTNESFIVNLQIYVTDENDNSPIFEYDRYQFNIPEGHNPTRTIIGNVKAYDIDAPNTVNSRIEYYIVAIQDSDGNSIFLDVVIDIITGDISVIGTLDRELSNNYTLTVQAEDNGEPKPLSSIAYVDIYLSDVNDNAPQFSIKNLLTYVIYFAHGSPSNSQPYRIVAQTQFGTQEVTAIEFNDPDSSGTAIATLINTNNLVDLLSPLSPLAIITTSNVTYSLNGTIFSIKISDGEDFHDEIVDVLIFVTSVMATTVVPTTTSMSTGSLSVTMTSTITPPINGVEEFFTSELGIAIIVVGAILIFAILFFLCCLMCYCYQRYQTEQDRKKE